ncbi:unnamed protein product [Lathyrus sativus]|nr:unnamed protein product [Lathyrus sativus]
MSSSGKKHDVFISFRGQDTRASFTSHLYGALTREKIKTYIDYALQKGDRFRGELVKTIQDSTVSLVIFSENYASSKWCLDELVEILECRKNHGQVVIPVFYRVDPSHVRHQKGSYERAFAKYEREVRNNESHQDKVLAWRAALVEAANISGYDSTTFRTESEVIQNIVRDVWEKLTMVYPKVLKEKVSEITFSQAIEARKEYPKMSASHKKYDVFISFRGEDTRETFTSHLHYALQKEKIETYIDYKLQKGDQVWGELVKAIQNSTLSLVVFSENYASSTWCLNELVEILECRKNHGQVVIPVFYRVDPSHVRHQKESYEKAFAKYEIEDRNNESHQDKVLAWRAALVEAANISGYDSTTFR